jgi:hypothetical protein
MKKKYSLHFIRREKIIKKIFECQRNGVVNVHQVAKNSFFSVKEIINTCEYLASRGVLRANRIDGNITISYVIVQNIFQ